ncbi:anion permease [Saccharospirillum alexandrii]|uniref:anion permease n=1 Tax=Saccharospirillum alexandrii TaxID=2448477 RepID=UPI000FD727AA|nr:anion permease [Saccharospirillum alexandrii]
MLLVGCALALGNLMTLTGLAQVFGAGLADRIGNVGPLIVSFLASGTAILFSEISTNLVSITVLVPTIPPVAEAGGGNPLVVALIATFSAIYGFMLPISTSANAIVFGSGQVPVWQMIKTGFFVDLSGILVIVTGVTLLLHVVQVVSL